MVEPARRRLASPLYVALLATAVLIGFRESMSGPYLTLFAIGKAGLGPLDLGVFLTARALGGIVFSMAFGAWFDRAPGTLPMLVSLIAGAAGYGLLASTTDFGLLLLIAAVPLGMGGAAFPLVFAVAKSRLAEPGSERAIAVLRAAFSAAWGVGPALGAAAVGAYDYTGLFLISAVCGVLACASLGGIGGRAPAASNPPRGGENGKDVAPAVGLTAASFTLYSMAMVMGAVALPVVVTRDLHGTTGDVGLIASLSALLEVPVMAGVAWRPGTVGGLKGMVAGFAAFTAFFLLSAWAPSVGDMAVIQVLRALGIGLVSCIGIGFMQDLMPNRAGAAAALYANTGQVGALLAGLAAGGWADLFGYRSMFGACAVASLLGLGLLLLGARPLPRLAPAQPGE